MRSARELKLMAARHIPIGGAARYFLALSLYPSLRKILNLIHCEFEKRRRVVRPRSFPYVATIDVNNYCNLRCPYCMTGQGRRGRAAGDIDLDHVRMLAEEFGDYLLIANIADWGEPLLSPKSAPAVAILHERGVFTSLSSNLVIKDKGMLDAVCDAGLDYLIMSIDGATQETYAQYRRGGNLALVLENVRHLAAYKRANKRHTPVLEWQYLVFQHNRHEIDAARQLAADLGADIFHALPGVAPPEEEVRASGTFGPRIRDDYCQQLWHCIVVQADGGVTPCCYLYEKKDDFGDLGERPLADMRQNERFVTARTLFRADAVKSLPPNMEHPCLTCAIVHRQPHLGEYLLQNPHAQEKLLSQRFAGPRIGPAASPRVSVKNAAEPRNTRTLQ